MFSLPGAFQFGLLRKGWYICRSEKKDYHETELVTDFNMASEKWLRRCSFALRPLSAGQNPLMNCFESRQPSKPPVSYARTTAASISLPNITTPTTKPTTVQTTHKPEGKVLHFEWFLNIISYNNTNAPFRLS